MDDTVYRRGDDEWRGGHRHLDDRLVGPVPEAMTIEQCLVSAVVAPTTRQRGRAPARGCSISRENPPFAVGRRVDALRLHDPSIACGPEQLGNDRCAVDRKSTRLNYSH